MLPLAPHPAESGAVPVGTDAARRELRHSPRRTSRPSASSEIPPVTADQATRDRSPRPRPGRRPSCARRTLAARARLERQPAQVRALRSRRELGRRLRAPAAPGPGVRSEGQPRGGQAPDRARPCRRRARHRHRSRLPLARELRGLRPGRVEPHLVVGPVGAEPRSAWRVSSAKNGTLDAIDVL